MTNLVFYTDEPKLNTEYTKCLCELFQEITDTIVSFKLLELPSEITIKLRDAPFEDDTEDNISVGASSVELNLIELRIPPVLPIRVIKVFIHELIHIQQGYLGWLREAGNGFVWFDKYFDIENVTREQYLELPWERQAFREQDEIWRAVKPYVGASLIEPIDCPQIEITVVN